MGMAASQARFLGLTARKSNVEYQVQQINQQRTSLANESAGLYNQMMSLSVPTPPAISSFVSTSYVLDDTETYSNSNYKITNMTKTYEADGQYLVSLSSTFDQIKSTNETYRYQNRTSPIIDASGNRVTAITLGKDNTTSSIQLSYVEIPKTTNSSSDSEDSSENNTTTEYVLPSAFANGALEISTYQIYPVEEIYSGKITGYNESYKNNNLKENPIYFYQDTMGKNHFLTQEDIDSLLGKEGTTIESAYSFATTYTYSKETITQVKARLEQSSNGRLTSIIIEENEDYPEALNGRTFSLSAVQETDQDGYDKAMHDYEYEKALYEKTISDINSQTETIQAKDQSLELKIKQLETEQKAISTEMDAVQNVIKDNIDKTFKALG